MSRTLRRGRLALTEAMYTIKGLQLNGFAPSQIEGEDTARASEVEAHCKNEGQ